MKKRIFTSSYIREIIFGFEDSFVSTVGALTGIAAGAGNRSIVILAGLVIIVVEATSMAAGSYISSKAADETAHAQKVKHMHLEGEAKKPVVAGIVMGVSYTAAGIFPLLPYLLLPVESAVAPSIILTLVMLFLVGLWLSRFTKRPWWKSGLEMVLVAGLAILLGFIVGRFASLALGIAV